MDRGAWQVTVQGVAKSLTWLKSLSTQTSINLEKTNFSKHKTLNKDDRQDGQVQNPKGSSVMEYQLSYGILSVTEYSVLRNTTTNQREAPPEHILAKREKEMQSWRVKYEQHRGFPKKESQCVKKDNYWKKSFQTKERLSSIKSLTEY